MKKLCAALIVVFAVFMCLKVAADSMSEQPEVNYAAITPPVEKVE